MTSATTSETMLTIELNEEEAIYLRCLTQNFYGKDLADEPEANRKTREALFNSTNIVNELLMKKQDQDTNINIK